MSKFPAEPLFLGLDCSTQSLKAVFLTSSLKTRWSITINFDASLPQYGTREGVHLGPKGSNIVNSPVMMLVEACDLLGEEIQKQKVPVQDVVAISGAGQQHASVYWSQKANEILGSLDPSKKLVDQMSDAFARKEVPNWQDSSTIEQCRRIEEAVGGKEELTQITGSRAHARFTGSQILRWREEDPKEWEKTGRVSLVSSWLCTMLCLDGEVKPIDRSDVAGMNLWDLKNKKWHPKLLEVVGGQGRGDELKRKLGDVELDGGRPVGKVGKWWVERFGFNPDGVVFTMSGDNPMTFLAFTLKASDAIVSLGTSDTVLLSTQSYAPLAVAHLFSHPAEHADRPDRPTYMAMLCYKNGSLSREYVRDQYCSSSWDTFNANASLPGATPSPLGFYFLKPTIIPPNLEGIHFYQPSESASSDTPPTKISAPPPDQHPRLILTSQFLSFRIRTADMLGFDPKKTTEPVLSKVYVTGGASSNPTIRRYLANALGAPVYSRSESGGCSVGAARKARWGWERLQGNDSLGFQELMERLETENQEEWDVTDWDKEEYELIGHQMMDWLKAEEQIIRETSA
ncbi:actin-like ATPase domain-containing protein [Atractiella rhizophila]|nr:actin-like ATPase domain-containing protein [Atractiella rhizophila]